MYALVICETIGYLDLWFYLGKVLTEVHVVLCSWTVVHFIARWKLVFAFRFCQNERFGICFPFYEEELVSLSYVGCDCNCNMGAVKADTEFE